MDLEIVNKRENPLLKRTEITFRLTHPKEKTPQRMAVRDKLAGHVQGKKEGIIIEYMRSHYGTGTTTGYAKVYESADAAKKMEPEHLLKRHGLVEAKKEEKKEEAKAPPPPPPKKK